LLLSAKIQRGDNRLAVVANRVKRNTTMFKSLMRFLESLKIPIVAVLRDSQAYIKSAESGVGVHEMKGARLRVDQGHWAPLIDWLENGVVPVGDSAWADFTKAKTPKTNAATADDDDDAANEPIEDAVAASADAPSVDDESPAAPPSDAKPLAPKTVDLKAFITKTVEVKAVDVPTVDTAAEEKPASSPLRLFNISAFIRRKSSN
jgi:hypothetical protein